MKHLLLLVPVLACLVSCQDATTSAAVAAEPTLAKQAQPSADSAKPAAAKLEYIESDMLTINGQPAKELTTSQLVRQLGRPDSIAKGAIECGAMLASLNKIDSPDGDAWYYGNTMYEVSGKDAIIGSFDVTTGRFQGKLGQLLLNQSTTLEDVRRFFPTSAKEADVPSSGRPGGEEMSLPFYYKGEQTDDYLLLFFKKGRLQQVDFYSPC